MENEFLRIVMKVCDLIIAVKGKISKEDEELPAQ